MAKNKILIIIGTVLAMALVAALLVLWLVPGNNAPASNDTTGVVTDSQGSETDGTNETQETTVDNGPAIGVEVENSDNIGNGANSGSSGNTGNSGNSGNTGNTGDNGNQGVIEFDDLLGG